MISNMNDLPKRKSIRLNTYDYSSTGAYFVTICTENRKNYFWTEDNALDTFFWNYGDADGIRPQNLPLTNIGRIICNELE